jgi:hypothetical protein
VLQAPKKDGQRHFREMACLRNGDRHGLLMDGAAV